MEKEKKYEKKDNILCQCLAGTESCTAVLISVIFAIKLRKDDAAKALHHTRFVQNENDPLLPHLSHAPTRTRALARL